MTQGYSIQWDPSLPPFAGPGADLPDVGYAIEAMADGTNFGNPEALIEVVKSLLTDGSLAVLEGWDNRQAPIRLRLSAPTAIAGPALAEAEKALMLAVQARSKAPLVYVPPAQDAATCVFDVVAAKLDRDTDDGWDLDEVRREYRYYLLTLTCLPFARTEESVVVPALAPPPVSPSTVVIDNCLSLTNWTASVGLTGPPPTSGDNSSTHAVLTRTAAVSMGATPYLKVTATATYGGSSVIPVFQVDGTTLPVIARAGANTYYLQPPASFTTLTVIGAPNAGLSTAPASTAQVTEVARTNQLPAPGTARQQARTVTVEGSAPTQAAIRLYRSSPFALGDDILIYTSKNSAFSPALRPYLVASGTTTPDSSLVSGGYNTLGTTMEFEIPASLITEGTYALVARMNIAVAGSLTWSARMVYSDGSGATPVSDVVIGGTVALGVTSGFDALNLTALSLPVVAVEYNQKIEITLTGTANMSLDEAWLFNLDDGALTWVQSSSSYIDWVEVRSPELGAARPSVYGGQIAPGQNGACIDSKCKSFGSHRFEPGLMQVFTVTTNSLETVTELEFYPRYHSHVEGSSA